MTIFSYGFLLLILIATPALWTRWWHYNRFTAYSWTFVVFMACTGIVYLGFGEIDWTRVLGLFVLMIAMTAARLFYGRKRDEEARAAEQLGKEQVSKD